MERYVRVKIIEAFKLYKKVSNLFKIQLPRIEWKIYDANDEQSEGIIFYENKNGIFLQVGKIYIEREKRGEEVPLPYVLLHEMMHYVLNRLFPWVKEDQEYVSFMKRIIIVEPDPNEFWTELFTNLTWRVLKGKWITSSTKLDEIPLFYIKYMKETLESQENSWWLPKEISYLMGCIVGEILWYRYGQKSLTILKMKLKNCTKKESFTCTLKEVLSCVENEFKKYCIQYLQKLCK